jgi:hypothetical protein
MSFEDNKYRLLIRPGILKDGTYGVYVIPENNPAVEYQLDAQFASVDEAREMAEEYLKFVDHGVIVVARLVDDGKLIEEHPSFVNGRFVTDQIIIQSDREIHLETLVTELAEEKQAAALKAHLKKMVQIPTSFKIAPFAKITETTPYLLSIACLIVFGFSLSFTVPKDIPLLGDVIGGRTFSPAQTARLFPFVLLASTIYLQIRARAKGLANSAIRDNVLSLALQRGWRRDKFANLLIDTMESEDLGWLRKISEWMQSWDPNTLRQVREDAARKQVDSSKDVRREVINTGRLLDEDFEARIHALYYMEKEPGYRPWSVIVHPLLLVMTHRRAVRRARAFALDGLRGVLYLGMCSLPGGDDYRLRRKMFPILAVWPVLMFGVPLVWAFILQPWPTVFGLIGMTLLTVVTLVPLLLWNYKLMIQCRGLPRAMSWEEIQGDLKFIRGL